MRLGTWLSRRQVTQAQFARSVRSSQAKISQLINGGVWLSRALAERIMLETDGAVTPTDFLWPERAELREYEVPFEQDFGRGERAAVKAPLLPVDAED